MKEKVDSDFSLGLAFTNLPEICATPAADLRERLLSACRHLLHSRECIRPYSWIVPELARMLRRIIQSPECEAELTRPGFVGTEQFALEALKDLEASSDQFDKVYDSMRRFDAIFAKKSAKRPDAAALIKILRGENGVYWKLAARMYSRGCGKQIDEAEAREFAEACPPFKAVLLSQCIAQYYRCIRDQRGEGTRRARRLDLFMAAYLPYCDLFVTEDVGQLNSLRLVASQAAFRAEIFAYKEFNQNLSLKLGSGPGYARPLRLSNKDFGFARHRAASCACLPKDWLP